MKRKIIEDIVVRKKLAPFFFKKEALLNQPSEVSTKENPSFLTPPNPVKRKLKYYFISLGILVFGGGLLMTSKLSSMTINITPKQETFTLDAIFEISGAFSDSILTYKTAENTTDLVEADGFATEIKNASEKAKGRIVVFNTSATAQNLIGSQIDPKKQTRFETSDGKIFRIRETIRVPAQKGGVPGSVEATVYADKDGEEYNVGRVDLKVPGLKGTPQYEKVYARSKDAIGGGFIGNALVISKEDYQKAKQSLESKIKKQAINSVIKEIPGDFILYSSAYEIEIEEDALNPEIGSKVNDGSSVGKAPFILKGKARIRAYLLPKHSLSKAIISKINLSKETDFSKIRISNLESLNFSLLFSDKENKKMSFSLKGKPHLVWQVDKEALAKDIIQNKEEPAQIFQKYPNIDKANVVYRPSWWETPPGDIGNIYFGEEINSQ